MYKSLNKPSKTLSGTEPLPFLVALFLLIGMTGYGHDLFPPDWRGQDGTTYQSWTFDDASNPVIVQNEAGSATASITVGTFGTGWFYDFLELGQQTGYWDIGGTDGSIVLDIDNIQGGDYKLIRLQITYYEAIGGLPTLDMLPGAEPFEEENWQTVEVDSDQLGTWYVWQSTWIITPSPAAEQIILRGHAYGSIIDQIVVDTKVSPDVCIVNFDDLVILCQQWLQSGSGLQYDLDNSGTVDLFDFSLLAQYWQQTCPW